MAARDVTLGSSGSVAITAPTVAGYRFVCWVASSTQGWVGSTYFELPYSASTRIWRYGSGTGVVKGTALYVRDGAP